MILNCPHCENEFYVPDELAGRGKPGILLAKELCLSAQATL
jgi:hypothetical protein